MEYINIWSSIILGVFGLVITVIYSQFSTYPQKDKFNKELFERFNEKYDLLNEHIQRMVDLEDKGENKLLDKSVTINNIQKNNKEMIIDYFNLCAEEYYWSIVKKRIDPLIWNSWNIGMKYWYTKSPIIKELWKEQKEGDGYKSYYLKDKEKDFFNFNFKH